MKDVKVLTDNGVNVEKSLELFETMDVYDETLIDFVDEVDDKLVKAKQYMDSGMLPDYAIFVHSLKTGARYLGFEVLGEMAFKHEMESKEGNHTYITTHFDELVAETNKAVTLAKKYLTGQQQTTEEASVIENLIPETLEVPSSKKTILIADDSSIVSNFICRTFEADYEVIVAEDGQVALDIIYQRMDQIDCLLLDLNMPNVDGFGVLEHFKANNLFNQIPISIITGNDTKDEIARAFTYQIVDMLSKPFSERDVKSIVERTIAAKKAE